MRYQLQILLSVLLCMVGKVDASSLYDYGLSLKSHSVPGIERTTLYLDDNQPFSIKNDFIISFQMYVRANEHDFGTILHLHTNTNQFIRFSFVAGEERHFPALVLNEGIININSPIEREKWLDVSLHLRLKDNVIEIDISDGSLARSEKRNGFVRTDERISFGRSSHRPSQCNHHTRWKTDT